MIEIALDVLHSEDGQAMGKLKTLSLPAVPRVGDTLMTDGAEFEVRAVVWHDTYVSLHLYDARYGYHTLSGRGGVKK